MTGTNRGLWIVVGVITLTLLAGGAYAMAKRIGEGNPTYGNCKTPSVFQYGAVEATPTDAFFAAAADPRFAGALKGVPPSAFQLKTQAVDNVVQFRHADGDTQLIVTVTRQGTGWSVLGLPATCTLLHG